MSVHGGTEPDFPNTAFLSLGSNVGDRHGYLRAARERIQALPELRVVRSSTILDNPALIHEDQAAFLNQILQVATSLSPDQLLDSLQELERALGRQLRFRYGPREIDLDILAFSGCHSSGPRLFLPHPGLKDREYLRVLLGELGESPESLDRASRRSEP